MPNSCNSGHVPAGKCETCSRAELAFFEGVAELALACGIRGLILLTMTCKTVKVGALAHGEQDNALLAPLADELNELSQARLGRKGGAVGHG